MTYIQQSLPYVVLLAKACFKISLESDWHAHYFPLPSHHIFKYTIPCVFIFAFRVHFYALHVCGMQKISLNAINGAFTFHVL